MTHQVVQEPVMVTDPLKNGVLENKTTDIIIIGGGLAGLVAALHLSRSGYSVILVEKNPYPRHKVCGEYISNEVLPYLAQLGLDPVGENGAKRIGRLMLSTVSGKSIETKLPLGGFSVSRYTLDHDLCQKAIQQGCRVIQDAVSDIRFAGDHFEVITKENGELRGRIAIGAFGKRSNIDVKLERPFIKKRSPYIAVKTHLQFDYPDDLVALHNFKGGYCGVSMVENGNINVCYLAEYESFQRYKDIHNYQENVLYKNPHLKNVFENSKPVFDQPLTISQVSFQQKSTVENHMLMCGDAAGMIHPLCGNGMAMAIHSAKIAAEQIIRYFQGYLPTLAELEKQYQLEWDSAFRKRLKSGRVLQSFFAKENIATFMLFSVTRIPGVLPAIIRRTHGKPIRMNSAHTNF